jgi:hypothetical protein
VPPAASTATPPAPAAPAFDVSKLTLQVVVYSEIPAQRMVFIDGRRYVEGDALDAETTVERITPDGVVLNRGGRRAVLPDRRP